MADKLNSSLEKFRSSGDQKANGPSVLKEDSSLKLNTEEESDGIGDAVLCKSSLRETSFYFEGVRFSPKVIEFIDAFEGKQFAVKIKIQNVDKKPVLVRIGEPNSFIFQLKKPSRRVRLLASGSSLTKTITYSYHNDDLVQKSQIPIQINGRLIDYPIVVKKATPEITVEPNQLDFKKINLGASAKTMMLTIHNSGGKRTKFEIDLGKNDLDLVVSPIRGTIKAKSKVTAQVEMMGMTEGEYFKELWVTTNEMSTRVPVIVEVVRPRLEIIHPNVTEDFVLIDFRPTFVNTQRAESFLLKNYSADTTLFITLAEIGGSLQFLKDVRKNHETSRVFMFTAEEGRLEPFESRVLTALFTPKKGVIEKGWHQIEGKNKQKKEIRSEHIVFVRMTRVHCIEIKELAKVEAKPVFNTVKERSDPSVQSTASLTPGFSGPPRNLRTSHYVSQLLDFKSGMNRSSGFLTSPSLEEKVLRLCLHGTAVEPNVTVQPSRFDFEATNVGCTQKKVLTVKNESVIGIMYNFNKVSNVAVTPSKGWLKPHEAFEFLISVTPSSGGKIETNLQIEILAKSDVVFPTDKSMVTVANIFVPLTYTANLKPVALVPKIGLGITPIITNEVGLLKDLVTFKSDCKKPRAAMLSVMSKTLKPEWMKQDPDKVANVNNAIIAFPNDRPRYYYSWAKENICRTIFKGFFRYSPPEDTDYTLTPEERCLKKKNYLLWKDYLQIMQASRLKDSAQRETLCERNLIAGNLSTALKLPPTEKLIEKVNKFLEKKLSHPKHDLVPLSPQHLNNINVEPKLINFGTVATNNLVHETLTVYNMNPFPIGIRFIPGKTAVKVVEGDTIIISPFVTKSLAVSFETNDLGRHYGFLNYVINGSHQFKITISAYVTSKTLMLEDKNLVIEFGNCPAEYAFQPRCTFLELGNLLQSPINYHWQLPIDSAFIPDNLRGEVPARTQLLTEIKFDMLPKKSFYSELNLISESGSSELIKLIYAASRTVSVFFLTNRIEVGDVPLNLPTKVVPVIQNACYHGVVFEVINWNPIPGVVVHPREGVLKPRSFLSLEITMQIPVIMKFSFDVIVCVHLSQKITVKVTGNVVVPMIRIKPTEVVMRKICSNSFDTVALCIENAGSTPAEIDIDLQGCPEYSVVDNKSHICLPSSSESTVNIRFQPKDVARYVFYLPIVINKILGPPLLQEPQTEHLGFYLSSYESQYEGHGKVHRSESIKMKIPCVCINSTVSLSLLTISSPNVNFCPLALPASKCQCQSIVMSNEFVDEVTFCIRTDDLGEVNESPFDLLPANDAVVEMRSKAMKAHLKQGEKLVLNATFKPQKPGLYEVDVPIFVKGYSNGVVYNYINLRGEFKEPELRADVREIHFPPLPLNVGCDVIISIVAEHYDFQDTISCLIWSPPHGGDTFSNYLSVAWLKEPKINPLREAHVFQAQVTFCSSIPIGIRNYLVFIDSSGNHCSVLVTAMADNSAVTTHAFLTTRTSKYKLVRDVPSTKSETNKSTYPLKNIESKPIKLNKKGIGRKSPESKDVTNRSDGGNNVRVSSVDKGSRLVVQTTKSMTRLTQLNFVNPSKESFYNKGKDCSSTLLNSTKSRTINSSSQSDSYSTARSVDRLCKESGSKSEVTYPNFPQYQDTLYGKHFHETLLYLERWMFEVVMRCDQYFQIPKSFQKMRGTEKPEKKLEKNLLRNKNNSNKWKAEKDFLDFLEEVVDPDMKENLPRRSSPEENDRLEGLYIFYTKILKYLNDLGCNFPHIKPEYLFNCDDYCEYVTNHSTTIDVFNWVDKKYFLQKNEKDFSHSSFIPKEKGNLDKEESQSSSLYNRGGSWERALFGDFKDSSDDHVVEEEIDEEKVEDGEKVEMRWNIVEGKQFIHESKILEKRILEARSTQAWFDIIIQIFRTIVLTRIHHVPTIPEIEETGINETINITIADVKSYGSRMVCNINNSTMLENNLYSLQERMLLMWLNKHNVDQRDILLGGKKSDDPRPINNFDKDLADSIALILVTAAYCPYVIGQYFSDIFVKPDTPSKMYHNASKLTLAWKTLSIGLTVESIDLVNPNPVFMILLVTQLYKVLPTLYPRMQINFSAPLSLDFMRTLTIKNEYRHSVFYQVKFMGEHEGLFRLKTASQMIQAKGSNTTDVNVVFTARRIKNVSAILIFCGYIISPNFAQHVVFSLEGVPSDLRECTKLTFSAPLYKVLCTQIPICPPYSEPTTYDIWYTTNKPEYKEASDIFHYLKPWSKIWNRKVARRLFLNKCDITIEEGSKSAALSVAVACMTEEERNFWLLFRSFNVGDFIVLISIKANSKMPLLVTNAVFSELWSEKATCLCLGTAEGTTLDLSTPDCQNCPLYTEINIPMRNNHLWDSVKSMFLRTLHAQEKSFWSKHFEKNIGLCLILWFISMEEEEDVADEFIHILQTRILYRLKVEPPNNKHITIPPTLEISDVRENSNIKLPIHLSPGAPKKMKFVLAMASEDGKELRRLKIILSTSGSNCRKD